MATLYNIENKYSDIVSEDTFEKIKELSSKIDDKEKELSDLNSRKISLELELEKLRKIFDNFRGLIEIKKIADDQKKRVDEVKTSHIFGIISEGEGNTRIG